MKNKTIIDRFFVDGKWNLQRLVIMAPGNIKIVLRFVILMVVISPLIAMGAENSVSYGLKLSAPAVAYQPRGFNPNAISSGLTESQIRKDLRLLNDIGFRGVVTYGSQGILGEIPEISRSEGFDDIIIMGIWDIFSSHEWQHAVSQAPYVDGYCLGNEGLGVRYSADELLLEMKRLRIETGRPVTTSEPILKYFQTENQKVLCEAVDWIFPIIHPFYDQPFDPLKAARWAIVHYEYLKAITGHNIIIKEAGFPTAGHKKLNQNAQVLFFQELSESGLSYFHFEAFDQPWKAQINKNPVIEAHWGILKSDGTPKKIVVFLKEQWK